MIRDESLGLSEGDEVFDGRQATPATILPIDPQFSRQRLRTNHPVPSQRPDPRVRNAFTQTDIHASMPSRYDIELLFH